jgi:hypothetical protein
MKFQLSSWVVLQGVKCSITTCAPPPPNSGFRQHKLKNSHAVLHYVIIPFPRCDNEGWVGDVSEAGFQLEASWVTRMGTLAATMSSWC